MTTETERDALHREIARLTPLVELERALPAAGNPYTGNASELERANARLMQLDENEAEARRARFAAATAEYLRTFEGEADDRAELKRRTDELAAVAELARAPHSWDRVDAFHRRGPEATRRRDEARAAIRSREAKRARLLLEFPILANVNVTTSRDS